MKRRMFAWVLGAGVLTGYGSAICHANKGWWPGHGWEHRRDHRERGAEHVAEAPTCTSGAPREAPPSAPQ